MVGNEVIATLATRFPQLYVAPADGAQEAHALASRRGIAPEGANLDHFATSAADELREVMTPAGSIEVVFLANRADFETFLQIIGHKAMPDPISPTVGAITYLGLADWGAVARARRDYLEAGGEDWASEFVRLAKQTSAFRAEIVVISQGPYSNIASSETPYDEQEWLRISSEIRLHHECAHVVCRRLMPQNVAPIWDEVTADVVGLACATGSYDAALAARFLGVGEHGFTGGRLSEYVDDGQAARIDEVAADVYGALTRIEAEATAADLAAPFDFLLELKRAPLIAY